MSVASPCRLICRYNDKGVCVGCFRTKEEITDWITLSDDRKLEIWKNLRIRKNKSLNR